MANHLRDVRLSNEWELLNDLCNSNPDTLGIPRREFDGDGDAVSLVMRNTGGLIPDGISLRLVCEHTIRFHYPRFYPAVPIEAYLEQPVFHPNVDPQTGF